MNLILYGSQSPRQRLINARGASWRKDVVAGASGRRTMAIYERGYMIGTNMGDASRLRWPARARVRREAPAGELGVVEQRVLPKPREVRFLV
jgi:hypothetical protein